MSTPSETWRVFVAIELPAEIRNRVTHHIANLRRQVPDARASWSREENLHLTLKFLGDIPVTRVEALSRATARAAQTICSFSLSTEGCGSFPPRGTPRVLWIGIEDPAELLHPLHRALEDACADEGFARERRAFHPHLTVARLRRPKGARPLADLHRQAGFERMGFAVGRLCVIRSELSYAGSRYTVIARHALGKE